jgi:histidyl-tRNA synthetase
MISVRSPSGFRDFINEDARRRLKLMGIISDVYQSFGFRPLETPALENLELLTGGGGGEENEKLIFKVLKRGDKLQSLLDQGEKNENHLAEFGLRFDLTLPLSRVVALHRGEIQLPWKVFHMGPVWRAERSQKGRFREFIQCDVDVIGAKGIGAEIEVIQAVVQALHQVGAPAFELRLNDRRLIQAMGEKFGFKDEALNQFAILLDKKDKMDLSEIHSQLRELSGQDLSQELIGMIDGKLGLESVSDFHPEAARDLKTLISTVQELQLPLSQVVFDPSLVRGMGYYTGPVFELRHSSAGYSFGGGGRYDRLIGRWSSQEVPACGFSIGFERLVLLLAEADAKSEASSNTLFMPVFDESLRGKTLKLAMTLRKSGLEVDVYPDQAKIKHQFKFAAESGYRWVVIGGEAEWSSKVFKLKDFKNGSEVDVPEELLPSHLKGCLS